MQYLGRERPILVFRVVSFVVTELRDLKYFINYKDPFRGPLSCQLFSFDFTYTVPKTLCITIFLFTHRVFTIHSPFTALHSLFTNHPRSRFTKRSPYAHSSFDIQSLSLICHSEYQSN